MRSIWFLCGESVDQAHWLIYAVDSCLLLCGPQRKGPSPDFAIAVSRGLERIRCAVLGGREYTS